MDGDPTTNAISLDKLHRTMGFKDTVATLTDFFKGSDTKLGVFYPNHYLIAVFSSFEGAQSAASKLRAADFAEGDVIAARGAEVIELAQDELTVGSAIMKALSRFFATEQVYADHDLDHARHGAGFLGVYCPKETAKTQAWDVIQFEGPLDARYYANGGIEHLAGDSHTD